MKSDLNAVFNTIRISKPKLFLIKWFGKKWFYITALNQKLEMRTWQGQDYIIKVLK